MAANNRLPELDTLRGIAAISVCLFHFAADNSFLNPQFFKYGSTGVDLFFIISGFVIFMSLTNTRGLKYFWIARISRLYPAYWLSIIIAAVTFTIFKDFPFVLTWSNALGNILMIQPLFRALNFVGVYWTLYIELNFYLFISIIYYLKKMNNIENIVFIGLLLMLTINGYYLFNKSFIYERFFAISRGAFPLILHFQMFAAGIIFYRIYTEGYNWKRLIILILCLTCTLVTHSLGGKAHFVMGVMAHLLFTVIYFALFFLLTSRKLAFLKAPWLTFFGTISYSLYLIHSSFGLELDEYMVTKQVLHCQ